MTVRLIFLPRILFFVPHGRRTTITNVVVLVSNRSSLPSDSLTLSDNSVLFSMKHAAVTSHGLKEPDLRNLSDQKRVKMLLGSFKDSKRSVSGKPTMIKTHHSSSGNQPKHWRTGRLRGTTCTRRDLAMMNEALDVRDSEEIRKKDPVNLLALQVCRSLSECSASPLLP